MHRKGDKVYVNGRMISVGKLAEAREFNRTNAKYIKARHAARERARQIREKNGPNSMEWVQSALFLYAVRKHGLHDDLRRAIWAYTSAMVVKLEDILTRADRMMQRGDIDDSYHWTALQLRAAIRNHMKLLDMFKDEEITVPPPTQEGTRVCGITHSPTDRDSSGSMDYMLTEFRQRNPDADDVLPKKDHL